MQRTNDYVDYVPVGLHLYTMWSFANFHLSGQLVGSNPSVPAHSGRTVAIENAWRFLPYTSPYPAGATDIITR